MFIFELHGVTFTAYFSKMKSEDDLTVSVIRLRFGLSVTMRFSKGFLVSKGFSDSDVLEAIKFSYCNFLDWICLTVSESVIKLSWTEGIIFSIELFTFLGF